jgi:hypothetical protein
MLKHSKPEAAERLLKEAQAEVQERWKVYEARASQNGAAEAQPAKEAPHA